MKIFRLKSIAVGVVVIGIFQLAGCATNPEQSNKESLQYLNIYKDNRVVLRTSHPSTDLVYSINDENQVVAYKLVKPDVGLVYLNAVDIARLTSFGETAERKVAVTLRTGEKFNSSFAKLYICDKLKKCNAWDYANNVPLATFNKRALFGTEVYGLEGNPESDKGRFSFNNYSSQTIDIDSGVEAVKFNNETLPQARASMKQRWDERGVKMAKESEAYNKRMIEAENTAVSRRQVDCTSTGFSLGSPMENYSDKTVISCDGGKFRGTVGSMREKGWSIANVRTFVVPANVGSPAHAEHTFIFSR